MKIKESFLTTEISGSAPKRRGRPKMAPGTSEADRQGTHLTGRGGIGLVTFHLARRRIEFAVTADKSPAGDIWISVRGEKYGIEVKTCRDVIKWQIKKSQIKAVDFYVLVAMRTAQCFILTTAEMSYAVSRSPLLYGDVCMVDRASIDPATMNAWDRFDGHIASVEIIPNTRPGANKTVALKYAQKTVRKTLADGTVKTYSYDRSPRKVWTPTPGYIPFTPPVVHQPKEPTE